MTCIVVLADSHQNNGYHFRLRSLVATCKRYLTFVLPYISYFNRSSIKTVRQSDSVGASLLVRDFEKKRKKSGKNDVAYRNISETPPPPLHTNRKMRANSTNETAKAQASSLQSRSGFKNFCIQACEDMRRSRHPSDFAHHLIGRSASFCIIDLYHSS